MQMGGISQMLGLGGGNEGSSETFSVIDYMQSHDAVNALQKQLNLVSMFRRPGADPLFRLWWSNPSAETLLAYYERMVTITYREESGITELDVKAFRPQDAYLIANSLLAMGEDQVNAFNARLTTDTVKVAQDEVALAEARTESAEIDLTNFRLQHQDIDPTLSGTATMTLIAQLNAQIAQDQAQLAQMQGYLSPDSQQAVTLRNRIKALRDQIQSQTAALTGANGGALAPELPEYQVLEMKLQFAQQSYTSAENALVAANENAMKQQLFLIRVVSPSLPQEALYPKRFEIVLTVLVGLLVTYGIVWLLIAGVREHAA
jgi:capsular polysaccharide transport system permease protein